MVRPDGDYPISYPPLLSVLGKDREQQWREKAHEQVTRATNSLADRDTFGGTPAARKFASVYTAALTEYTAALKGAQDDLVTAAELRKTATAQLEEIQKRLSQLPAELAALKARGEEDVRAEKIRIAAAAAAERERLLEQTRREIAMRLRMARRELTEYAATLAVGVAHDRIQRTITPEDQLRLVDRYTAQLKEAR